MRSHEWRRLARISVPLPRRGEGQGGGSMNKLARALLLVLALGACGKDSGTNPDSTSVTGNYDLVIVPAADCGFPGGPYQVAVVAQEPGQTGSPPSANLRE